MSNKVKPIIWKIQETKCLIEGGLKLKEFRFLNKQGAAKTVVVDLQLSAQLS